MAFFGGGRNSSAPGKNRAARKLALLAVTASIDSATAAIKSQAVEYQHDDTTLEGAKVWDHAMPYADTDHGFTTQRNIGAAKSTGNAYASLQRKDRQAAVDRDAEPVAGKCSRREDTESSGERPSRITTESL